MPALTQKRPSASAGKRAPKSSAARASREEKESRAQFVSHFTPGLMTARVLEAIFVGRSALADRLMASVRSSATTNAKQQTLLVAPRGFGKSHLIALVYHRIRADQELAASLRVAWLREEEWGITSFLDLLLRIYRALNEQYPGELATKEWDSLYELDEAGAQAKAVRLLREFVGERTLLVLLENADDVFAGLGDSGQKRWRAFLQENNFCSTLLTSPTLFNGVSRRESPFFGFFRVIHLEPLSLDEAVELLHRLATLRGDQELADFLHSPVGRARVRAIHHLAGGNPRVYVIFAQFLTRQALDELVEPFFKMLDELTPYYQSRMQLISPQQRKIVEFLCDYRGAAAVKMVASRGFMTPQTASGQLLDLKDKGYVVPKSIGRETFYELREPLMRLCIEVKKNRGEPIGLLVDFLRLWYPLEQLKQQLTGLDKTRSFERTYLQHAIQRATEEEDPRLAACWDDAQRFVDAGNYEAAIQACSDLIELHPSQNIQSNSYQLRAACLMHLGRLREAEQDISEGIKLDASDPEAWELRARIRMSQERFEDALDDWNQIIESLPETSYLLERALIFERLGRKQNSAEDAKTALVQYQENGVKEAHLEPYAFLWLSAASSLHTSGYIEEAKTALRLATRNDEKDWEHYYYVSWLWQMLTEPVMAVHNINKAIEINPSQMELRLTKARLEIESKHYSKARRTLSQVSGTSSNVSQKDMQDVLSLQAQTELSAGDIKSTVHFLEQLPAYIDIDSADWGVEEQSAEEKRSLALCLILLTLLWKRVLVERWGLVCPKIISFFHHKKRVFLQTSLTQLIPWVVADVTPETPENAKTIAWLEAWKAAVGEKEELQLAIRLTETAIRYRQTLDERVLLELPVEERSVLEQRLQEIETLKVAAT